MRIGVAATGDVAIPTLNWLADSKHDLDLVISRPDKPSGRGRKLTRSIVANWAVENSIKLLTPALPEECVKEMVKLDLVLTIGYGKLIPDYVLRKPGYGFLNLHFSLLPKYRGAAPVQRAIENGEVETGVCVFELEKGIDTGPIYSQRKLLIEPKWRSAELFKALSELGPEVVEQALNMIENGQLPIPQSGEVTIAPKISKEDSKINFEMPAERVVNLIRALTFKPGARTIFKGQGIQITDAMVSDGFSGTPGEIYPHKGRTIVICGNGSAIQILSVIPDGKREMSAISWINGARVNIGDCFG